jgi:hypothetical protein
MDYLPILVEVVEVLDIQEEHRVLEDLEEEAQQETLLQQAQKILAVEVVALVQGVRLQAAVAV